MADRSSAVFRWIGIGMFALIGVVFAVGGGMLLSLGGSPYYLVVGLGLLAVAFLILRRRALAGWAYFAIAAATILWALFESGLFVWALLPRIAGPALLCLWFVVPAVRRGLGAGTGKSLPLTAGSVFLVALLLLGGSGFAERFEPAGRAGAPRSSIVRGAGDWSAYGNTYGGDRFSPAEQINRDNVGKLTLAWSFQTGDHAPMFEGAALKVGDGLFICTARSAIRLDPDTGKQVWRYAPGIDNAAAPNKACRGVSYYAGTGSKAFCDARLLWPTLDDALHAIDAQTGRPCPDFGKNGVIDLKANMGPIIPGYHFTTSPPVIVGNAAIFGALVYDNQSRDEPSGVVRAVDVHTGKLLWGWEVLTPTSRKSMGPDDVFARSSPNAWGVFSADPALGLVYVPTGNATPDYFGGYRTKEQDRYSSSIVALDAATGDVRWSFQTVHHDLWDMDVPAQPVVADLDIGGVPRKALIAPTKRGEIFVLDRATGTPLYPVEERRVPQGAAKGDWVSPTQPYPVNFPSFGPPHLTEADMWGATPVDQMICRILFKQRRYDGQFTPISTGAGSIGYPDVFGVFNWGSVSVDPERQIMFVNASWLPYQTRLFPRAVADAGGVTPYGVKKPSNGKGPSLHGDWLYAQAGTPYASESKPLLSPLGFPCHQPPWGAVAAIDLREGKLLWQRPFGTTQDAAPLGIALPTGVFNMGGSMLTRSGIAFIGAAIDNYIRAYDTETGALLWQARLPAGGQANPVSYVSEKSGRQFVVIAAGGHAALQTKAGDYLMAYALPEKER